MATIRFRDGRLLLYSPVFLTPALRQELDRLGRVAFLVSPNKIHNQTLAAYRDAFPEAALHAPPGLPERRPDIRFDAVLGNETNPAWSEELDQALTAGNVFFTEALLLHRRSRTLLVGDLIENIDEHTLSRIGRSIAALFGVPSRPAASPEFRFYTHDAGAAATALDRVREWPFERIFLCHGGLIERDAKAVFEAVSRELVGKAQRRGRLTRALLRRLADLQ